MILFITNVMFIISFRHFHRFRFFSFPKLLMSWHPSKLGEGEKAKTTEMAETAETDNKHHICDEQNHV